MLVEDGSVAIGEASMGTSFLPYDPNQLYLLPPSPWDWLPEHRGRQSPLPAAQRDSGAGIRLDQACAGIQALQSARLAQGHSRMGHEAKTD